MSLLPPLLSDLIAHSFRLQARIRHLAEHPNPARRLELEVLVE